MNAPLVKRIVGVVLALGAVVFVGLLGGAGSPALTQEATPEERSAYVSGSTTAAPDAGGDAVFAITSVDFTAGTVTIANHGDAAGVLDGYQLCNFPNYLRISGSIAPGATLDLSFGPLSADAGEVGLYTTADFASADAIVSYVEWGTADHQRSSVAVEAGIWDGSPVPGGGAGLTSATDIPTTGADWASE